MDWHKQLLIDMGLDIEDIRPPVISNELTAKLHNYLGFRHVFRNVYGFFLDTERVKALAQELPEVSKKMREEIDNFIKYLDILVHST